MKKEGAIRKTAGIRKAASVLILAAFLITAAIFLIHKNVPCKVAMLHMNPEYHQKEANITEICEMAAEAFENGADIVLTPEMATDDYYLSKRDVVTYAGIRNMEAELAPSQSLPINTKAIFAWDFLKSQRTERCTTLPSCSIKKEPSYCTSGNGLFPIGTAWAS